MNQSALKTFARDARNKLRQLIGTRLDYLLTADTAELRQQAAQVSELRTALKADGRDTLIERVAYTWFNRLTALRFMDANGYHPFGARVVTPATVNETLPEVLQQARAGALDADLRASIANPRLFDDLLAGRIPVDHPEAQVFKLLLLATCNYYHRLMPFLFEQLGDATELLLPEDLLTEHSIVADFREGLADDDCREVEVIGWLYQFYISEKKDAVMARKSAVPTEDIPAVTQLFTPHWIVRYLVENSLGRLWLLNRPRSGLREHMPYYIEGEAETEYLKITKPEDIRLCDPAAGSGHMLTYAFDLLQRIYEEEGYNAPEIPGLILRHNLHGLEICDRATALAAFALCMKARSRDRRFFRRLEKESAEVPRPHIIELRNVRFEVGELRDYIEALKLDAFFEKAARQWIEEGQLLGHARLFDSSKPAGSLLRLLESRGELPSRIGQFGLDEKAGKAFQKHLKEGKTLNELDGLEFERIASAAFWTFVKSGEILSFNELATGDLAKQVYLHFFQQFEEAKNFGSLIQPCLDQQAIADVRHAIEAKDLGGQLFLRETHLKVLRVLEQAEALAQRYHVVVANPPYMGSGGMNSSLKNFVRQTYPRSKADLMTCFMDNAIRLSLQGGIWGMICLPSWIFLQSFDELRSFLIKTQSIRSLLQLGRGIFGSDFGSVAFVVQNNYPCETDSAVYRRLFDRHVEVRLSEEIHQLFLAKDHGRFLFRQRDFLRLPGSPIAYWCSHQLIKAFSAKTIGTVLGPKKGLLSSDDERFFRQWHEVRRARFGTMAASGPDTIRLSLKWVPLNKGGQFRKWYGNHELVMNWENDGQEMKEWERHIQETRNAGGRVINEDCYFRSGVTWADVTSGETSFRLMPQGMIFNARGPCIFGNSKSENLLVLGYLNSKVAQALAGAVNPTICLNPSDLGKLPYPPDFGAAGERTVGELLESSQKDWDNFETSWDFRDQPLLRSGLKGATLEASWRNWEAQSTAAIRRMQELETENNRLFIAAYGLDGELQPEVPEEQITLARADLRKDMAAFLSFAVGCMMGRYSPDHPGLILANAGDTLREFLAKVGRPQDQLTFAPDEDGIIPVLDGEWFEDDIVARTRDFLRATFGEGNFAENLAFIEASLGKLDPKTGRTKPTDLRTYFARDFYKNHISNERAFGYKKRPIYWMFSSPEGSFQTLIYLHRYTRDTVNLLLNDYVREFIGKLEEKHRQLTAVTLNEATRPSDRTKAVKELGKIAKMQKELQAWERDILLPLAQQRIELDLDDGVKVNYLKFKGAVVNIPGMDKGEED